MDDLGPVVEAMIAEFQRQHSAGELIPTTKPDVSREFDSRRATSVYLMGRWDLEKVARAALDAAEDPAPGRR